MFRKTTIIFKGLAAGLLILSLGGWSFATTSYVPTRQVLEVGCTGGVGDVDSLIGAINFANIKPQIEAIELGEDCVYTLTQNHFGSANGLPVISDDLIIEGNGATIERLTRSLAFYRLLAVENGTRLTLSNLTLQGGLFSGGDGGAIHAGPETVLTLVNVRLVNNQARKGGALYTEGPATIRDSEFVDNTASRDGGGLFTTAALTLNNTNFINNRALSGGGLFSEDQVNITGGQFVTNRALKNDGGGLYVVERVTLIDTEILSNTAQALGGGVSASAAVVENSHFENNRALTSSGGGLAVDDLSLKHTALIGNSALSGGGVFADRRATIEGNIFIRNQASDGAGLSLIPLQGGNEIVNNVWFDNQTTGQRAIIALGGSLSGNEAGGRIVHNTVTALTPVKATAIDQTSNMSFNLQNNIIANHEIGVRVNRGQAAQPVIVEHNLYFGNTINEIGDISSRDNFEADPRFVDPANGDFHLQTGSQAIDRGLDVGVTVDLGRAARPQGEGFDIGAFEFEATSPDPTPDPGPNPGPSGVFEAYLPLVVK